MPRTGFKPEVNGFAFVNSWKLDAGQKQQMRSIFTGSVGTATQSTSNNFVGLFGNQLSSQIGDWIESALPDYYGMCGGMAFVAADHYVAGIPLPRGKDYHDVPSGDTPRGLTLRNHLWDRQIQSLQLNAAQLLTWMMMLHLPLPFAGPGWLLNQTRGEWTNLKAHLDQGHPWPLCLIGSSVSPFNNHQVLATGYDDRGDGTGVIYLYDMNDPGKEQTISLDMRGSALAAVESVPNADRGPLRAFFCEQYTVAAPPTLPKE